MSYKTNYELWSSPTPSYQSRRPSALSEIDLVLAQAYPHVAYSYCCHCYYDPECESESQPASPGGMSERSMMEVDRPRTGYGGKRSRRDQADSKKRKIRSRLRQFLPRGRC
ncbi:hypothetical protein VTN96DRAFT_8065 [Rasamsonia emersonii]